MGIQINGQTDTISAIDGSLTVNGADLPTVTNLNATGIVTATRLNVGTGGTVITTTVGGRMGVGKVTPLHKLEVAANPSIEPAGNIANFTNDTNADFTITCGASGITTVGPVYGTLALRSNNNEIVKLDLNSNINLVHRTFNTTHNASNRGASMRFGLTDGSFGGLEIQNVVGSNASFNSQNVHIINHNGGVAGDIYSLTCRYDGNIGIGITNPSTKVHILGTGNGSTGSTGLSDSSVASALLLKPTSGSGTALALGARSTGGHYIQGLYDASSVDSVRDVQINPYGGSVGIGTFADAFGGSPGNSTFLVATTGIVRFRITSDGSFGFDQTPGKYTIDTSNGATTIANGGTVDFSTASGMLLVNNHTNGNVTLYICGGGTVTTIANTGSAVGSFAYNAGINGYRWTNNYGSAAIFGFQFFRTRQNA
jgi:hypothetical protein